jgi:futalosine hydrolase
MTTLAVIAATHGELSLLLQLIHAEEVGVRGLGKCYLGSAGNNSVVAAVSGMGKVNTAHAAACVLARFSPELLINTGCAGAYPGSGLAVGDLAAAVAEVYGDEGVLTPSGWAPVDLIGIPLLQAGGKTFFNELPLPAGPLNRATAAAGRLGLSLRAGCFVTVSTCSGTVARGNELSTRFGGICETMEGAAAAHVALLHGIEFLEIRGISNLVEDRDLSRWDIPLAAERAQKLVYALAGEYRLGDG